MKYSVLMSVYKKEEPLYLRPAIDSMLNQSIKTDDFVVVWDGPLTEELERVLLDYEQEYSGIFRFLRLEKNQGLGNALNQGVSYCKNSLIARMDSDDIAMPDRIERQLQAFESDSKLALCGGQIEEFCFDFRTIESIRQVPCSYAGIKKYAKKRNPMNHMTVMFKKEAVLEVGNYQTMEGAEDYYLWVRMLIEGFLIINLPQVLVKARIGNGMHKRRGGWQYARNMIKLMIKLYQCGFLEKEELVVNIATRCLVSFLPSTIRRRVYKKELRK